MANRNNRGQSFPSFVRNCHCTYRMMFFAERDSSNTNNSNINNSIPSTSQSSRANTNDEHNHPTTSTRPCMCQSCTIRRMTIRINSLLQERGNNTPYNMEVPRVQYYLDRDSTREYRRFRGRNDRTFLRAFGVTHYENIPWPDMNSLHNYRRTSVQRSFFPNTTLARSETRFRSNRANPRSNSRPNPRSNPHSNPNSNPRTYSRSNTRSSNDFMTVPNSPGRSRRNSVQFGYSPSLATSLSSLDSENMSLYSNDSSLRSDSSEYSVSSNEHDECMVCSANPSEYILRDCRHICICQECIIRFRRQEHPGDNSPWTRCPVCQAPIRSQPRRC